MNTKTAIEDIKALIDIVAKDTGALAMSDPDKDSVGWTLEGELEMTFGHVRRAYVALGNIEDALSTDAELVAWLVKRYANDGSRLKDEVYLTKPFIGSTARTDFIPLYAAPPAPSFAVKALTDAYQKYLDAVSLYNERHAVMKTKALGTMRVDEEYKAIDVARRAFDKLAVEVATSALSAQVQDVDEWQHLDDAFSNFINGYSDPYDPKEDHDKETEHNLKVLYEAFNAYRAAKQDETK